MTTYITRRADFMANMFVPLNWQWRASVILPDNSLMWQWCKTRREAREWVKRFKS